MVKLKSKTVSPLVQANSFFLVGLMGSGKSTVGKLLAAATDRLFIDSDDYIEEKTGVDISYIFDVEGEEGFRKREACAIADLTMQPNIVLSTGGGAILLEENRRNLRRGRGIYLKISPTTIVERLKDDNSRPLLMQADRLAVLEALMKERERYYTEVADYIIMVDHLSPNEVVEAILDQVEI